MPLSPAERLRLYRRGLRVRRRSFPITIINEKIQGLVKRGYLGPSERDDLGAIEQAQAAAGGHNFRTGGGKVTSSNV